MSILQALAFELTDSGALAELCEQMEADIFAEWRSGYDATAWAQLYGRIEGVRRLRDTVNGLATQYKNRGTNGNQETGSGS